MENTLEKFPRARERVRCMIICVCGMIGSGKTEYAKRQKGIISDFDEIGTKEGQIKYTLNMDRKAEKVYHTTCFPTKAEREAFSGKAVKYLWINTGFNQCRENILKRNRKRDVENITDTLEKNREIFKKYEHSCILFEVINIFETGEKW